MPLLFLSLALPAAAQPSGSPLPATLTLEQVREESRRVAPAQLAALARARAEEDVRLARSVLYPQVALTARAGRTWFGPQTMKSEQQMEIGGVKFSTDPIEYASYAQSNFGVSLVASQLLYDGGRWWHQLAAADAGVEAAAEELREQQLAAEYEGVRRFYDLLSAQLTLEVLAANIRRSEEQVERAAALFIAGRAKAFEKLAAESNLNSDRRALLRQRSIATEAQASLESYLGREPQPALVAVAPSSLAQPPPAPGPGATALDQARHQRPLLRALDRNLRVAKLQQAASRAPLWPRVAAQVELGRAGTSFEPMFTDLGQQNSLSAGLTLSWELFSGFATRVAEQQAALARQELLVQLRQAEQELAAAVLAQARVLALKLEEIPLADAGLTVARQELELATEQFRAGLGSTLEVREAQLKVATAELASQESRIEAARSRAALERLVGGPVVGRTEVAP